MPPPLPPVFEAETPSRSADNLPPLPPGFEQETAPSLYAEEKERRDPKNPDVSFLDLPRLGRTAKGVAKTITGVGVGGGQILSGLDATGALGRLGETGPAQAIKRWSMEPAGSVAEEVGGVLPYLSPWGLERLAASMAARGALGGLEKSFLTPTESGSLESHVADAAAGGAAGGTAGAAGGRIPRIPHGFHLLHVIPGAGTLAWLAMQLARRTANAPPVQAARSAIARAAPAEAATVVRKANEEPQDAR